MVLEFFSSLGDSVMVWLQENARIKWRMCCSFGNLLTRGTSLFIHCCTLYLMYNCLNNLGTKKDFCIYNKTCFSGPSFKCTTRLFRFITNTMKIMDFKVKLSKFCNVFLLIYKWLELDDLREFSEKSRAKEKLSDHLITVLLWIMQACAFLYKQITLFNQKHHLFLSLPKCMLHHSKYNILP